ncbi:glycosyltransferase [Ornithinimicrobium sp. LYQ121]|uniref:glycosyltransferase n=1 Tax=Ornithinimicrobium sp. LYQ121 TaxID=3378801 RepID=UPI003853E0A6
MTRPPVRVQHIPAGHAYAEHLRPAEETPYPEVVHLPDPPVPGAPPGVWWPHPALEAAWVREHADEVDVVHLHFGTEGHTLGQLRAWLGALEETGMPLVLTVHDLAHPQLSDQTHYDEQLDLLVPAADALLTLTRGAADLVERRWGRRPAVVAHPHVVPLELVGAPRPPHDGLVVGLHLKSLRPNLDPLPVLGPLRAAVDRVAGAELVVHAHPEVMDPVFARYDADVHRELERLAADGRTRVVLTERMDDDQLYDYLRGLDVSVLAYAWGTHSGWVEACRDVGTWALAPDVGFVAEQGGVLTWGPVGEAPTVETLVGLLATARTAPPVVTADQRREQRGRLAAAHAALYRRLLDVREDAR